MSTDFLSAVITGLETVGTWALCWCGLCAALLAVVAGCRATAEIARRLEDYLAHPANRRKEDRP